MGISFEIEEAISFLRKTPSVLKSQLSGLPKKWVFTDEGEGSWNVHQVLGHLVYGEDADWLARTKIILKNGTGETFVPFDRLAQERLYANTSLEELLILFNKKRKQNLIELEGFGLSKKDLQKKGKHPEFGDITLKQMLSAWMVHDHGHIVQINRIIAKQYKDEIGPWKKYLTIVRSIPPPEK